MNSLAQLQRLDLHSLQLFATVAKVGSITRAAERSHIAASALSRRLAELEHLVGAALFLRSRNGIQITEVGRAVLQRAERIQDELRCLLEDASSLQKARARVRLCASHSVISGLLPELLRAFTLGAENVRVEICEAISVVERTSAMTVSRRDRLTSLVWDALDGAECLRRWDVEN